MKSKHTVWIGLAILVLVVGITVGFIVLRGNKPQVRTLAGFVGGEKIHFLENPQVQKILLDDYAINLDIYKAGSIDMVRADHAGKSFLFPSNQTALELYETTIGKPYKQDIIFNTPIVLYSHKMVADKLVAAGLANKNGEVYTVNMQAMSDALKADKKWTDIGVNELFGPITIDTTDPSKSNSGNMFSGLLANMLNGGRVLTTADLGTVLPELTKIFDKLGYMQTSSSDLFSQFLTTGVGNKPMIAGYENQLLEFSKMQSAAWPEVKSDLVILYPEPTVWSTHILIALDADGADLITALQDVRLQKIAWEQHGFCTGVYGSATQAGQFDVPGVAENITRIIQMPNQKTMEQIITAFE